MTLYPNDPRFLIPAALVVVAIAAAIAWGQLSTPTASSDRATLYVRPTDRPCAVPRLALACDRLRAAGWHCELSSRPGAVLVHELGPYELPEEGQHAAYNRGEDGDAEAIGITAGACGEDAPSIEHELLCHAYDVGHGGPAGTVCATPAERTGTRVPRRQSWGAP